MELTVRGNVQWVGYRNLVSQIAFELGLNGFVENLEDESVKIVVQGSREKLEEFIERIKVSEWPIVVRTVEKKELPTGERFAGFRVVRGEPQKEMLERADEAVLILSASRKENRESASKLDAKMDRSLGKLDEVVSVLSASRKENQENFGKLNADLGGKIDSLGTKMDSGFSKLDSSLGGKMDQNLEETRELRRETNENFNRLNENINGLRQDTKHNFDRMDKKYGSVSKNLRGIDRNIVKGFKESNKSSDEKLNQLNRNIVNGFKRQDSMSESLKRIDRNIVNGFTQLNKNLVIIAKAALSKAKIT